MLRGALVTCIFYPKRDLLLYLSRRHISLRPSSRLRSGNF
ncbi:predicted protein [Botrytis cinerea T4]|uniref:Uncharacterized protein n=1 Tax=Botryotinia fuckeliana (strain T4) TaxID=999810 RepID=G2YLY5_BOTF4|nr:predicted protein [Botrytis cinerea T4]